MFVRPLWIKLNNISLIIVKTEENAQLTSHHKQLPQLKREDYRRPLHDQEGEASSETPANQRASTALISYSCQCLLELYSDEHQGSQPDHPLDISVDTQSWQQPTRVHRALLLALSRLLLPSDWARYMWRLRICQVRVALTHPRCQQITDSCAGGCGQAFQAIIVSPQFDKKTLLARHRLVNSALKDEIAAIHAWTPKCYTPEQWAKLKEGI